MVPVGDQGSRERPASPLVTRQAWAGAAGVRFPLALLLQSLISTHSQGRCSHLEKHQEGRVSVGAKAHLVHG